MGEVYRARDPRLNRDVALKILPAEVAADPSRRQRFEIEARAVAALSHPNIVAVYDVGEGYIVSELVDGEPLRGARFGLRKTLDIAAQIASGLAAAHAAGVVHRDLKPENILLTRDGRAKILDFGLARMTQASGHPDMTMPAPLTGPGVVMGTVGYMSPEQVRGLDADHRSDIFSFGVVLHEMLGGARPFEGETAVDTMQADPAGGRSRPAVHRARRRAAGGVALPREGSGPPLPVGARPRLCLAGAGPGRQLQRVGPGRGVTGSDRVAHPRVAGGGCGPARYRRHRLHHPGSHARASPHNVVGRAAGGTGLRVARASFAGWPAPGVPGDGRRDDAGGRDGS